MGTSCVLLAGCGSRVTVLSSVDASEPVEAGVSAMLDGTPGRDDGQATQDAGSEQGVDAEASTDDGSDENVGPTCDVCTGGTTCQNGQCACPSGSSLCGSTCVDAQTDNGNCGGCGVVCSAIAPATATCTAGRCVTTLYSGAIAAVALAADATHAYVADNNYGGGDVIAVSNIDGTYTVLGTGSSNDGVAGLALDATGLYWTQDGNPGSVTMLSAGSAVPTILAAGQDGASAVAVDATSVYWTDLDSSVSDSGVPSTTASILKVSKSGGSPITLASVQNVLYVRGFAVDATSVYWTTTDSVMKMPTGGGIPTVLASAQTFGNYAGLAVDGVSVYWSTATAIMKVATDGGAVTTLASVSGVTPTEIVLDGTSVYWTYSSPDSNGGVMKMSTDGGAPTIVFSLPFSPADVPSMHVDDPIAVDATSVYVSIRSTFGTSTSPGGYSLTKVTPK